MRWSSSYLTLGILVLGLGACQPQPKVTESKETLLIFGTLVEVNLINVPPQDTQAVFKRINADLEFIHFAFHAWHPGPLGRTNELLAQTAEFTANPSVLPLIRRAQTLAEQSHELFNPAIGKLLQLWGFESDTPPVGPPPDKAAIAALVQQHPSMRDISINGIRLRSRNPAIKLDMGAIAKGYALDVVMQDLQAIGVSNAIINAGGGIKVLGQHGDRPWHIGIRDPRAEGVIAGLDLRDGESVSTSGDYERFFDYHGKRYCHILDPRTGYPADQTRSVTVIDKDGTLADAASTALFVAGPTQWLTIAKAMGITQAMLIDSHGVVYVTPQMQQRLTFDKPVSDLRVTPLP